MAISQAISLSALCLGMMPSGLSENAIIFDALTIKIGPETENLRISVAKQPNCVLWVVEGVIASGNDGRGERQCENLS